MTTTTEAQKRAKKRWVENNKELNNARHNVYTKIYYQNNKEARLLYAKEYRDKKKLENSESLHYNNKESRLEYAKQYRAKKKLEKQNQESLEII
jgi:hypothetical protein